MIKIADQMPPEDTDVILYPSWRTSSAMDVGRWWKDRDGKVRWNIGGTSGGNIGKDVTHWAELPAIPED